MNLIEKKNDPLFDSDGRTATERFWQLWWIWLRKKPILCWTVTVEQVQNDSDSRDEFDWEDKDPLFDSGGSFEPVLCREPTPSTSRGVTTFTPSQHDMKETKDSV